MAASSSSQSSGISNSDSGNFDILRERITTELKKEGIQLWLAPYTVVESGEVGQFPIELITRYSKSFQIDANEVATVIEILRVNAVKKLAANQKFKACGVATIRLKFVDKSSRLQNEKIETGLHISGESLREKIKEKFGFKEDDIKLICHGKLIANGTSLEEQGVRNSGLVMVIRSKKEDMAAEESAVNTVSRTKHAANILATKKRGGEGPYENYFLEISDQNGKPLKLPDDERQSLVLAMTLHEQGKKILQQRNFTEALLLLLGADEEFRHCRSEVLDAVDNYAILYLDIVWCYLQLKSIKELPGAEEMLRKCEVCLKKSYGENLERLTLLTGSSAKERVLFVRLYLLQAVCAFHKGETQQASLLLNKVEKEINNLKVDDATLSQMMSMGFSASESRLALRAFDGDVTVAVGYISRKREEKKRQIEEQRENRKKHMLARVLGKTANGEWISVDAYNRLREMGFADSLAKESLRQANNDTNAALQILNERPELLQFSAGESSSGFVEIPDDVLAQVTGMGFDVSTVGAVLEHYRGDVRRTIEKLLESGGALPPECEVQTRRTETADLEKGHTSQALGQPNFDEEREIEDALKEITPAFDENNSEESHLDLTLEEEASFVDEYRTLIATRSQLEKR